MAAYVSAFDGRLEPSEVQATLAEHCAAAPDIVSIVNGPSLTHVTATFAGPDADPALVAVAQAAVTDLGRHDTDEARPSPLTGPAYLIATVEDGGTTWQLEAGVPSAGPGGTAGAAVWVVEQGASNTTENTPPIAPPLGNTSSLRFESGGGSLAVGTAGSAVAAITDATGADATFIDWPTSLASYEDAVDIVGAHIWWLTGAGYSVPLTATLADGTSEAVEEGSRQPGADPTDLPGETVAEGRMPGGDEPWRVTADTCGTQPCMRTWVGRTSGSTHWSDELPPADATSVFAEFNDTMTLVWGSAPADGTMRVEAAANPKDDANAPVHAPCVSVETLGFERVCLFAALLPAGDTITLRFLDAEGNEVMPTYRDNLGGD